MFAYSGFEELLISELLNQFHGSNSNKIVTAVVFACIQSSAKSLILFVRGFTLV